MACDTGLYSNKDIAYFFEQQNPSRYSYCSVIMESNVALYKVQIFLDKPSTILYGKYVVQSLIKRNLLDTARRKPIMFECPKNCLSCSNSFSEPAENENEPDILHCMLRDGEIVSEDDYCEEYS